MAKMMFIKYAGIIAMYFSRENFYIKNIQKEIDIADTHTPVSLILIKSTAGNSLASTSASAMQIRKTLADMVKFCTKEIYKTEKDKIAIMLRNADSFYSTDIVSRLANSLESRRVPGGSIPFYVGISSTASKSVSSHTLIEQAVNALEHAITGKLMAITCYKDIVFKNINPGVKHTRCQN